MSEAAMVKVEQQEVTWTQEQKLLIKRTVAPDATDSELEMFLHIAAKSGLDPLQKQIHFTKRNGRVVVIADISGLQARAARNLDFRGSLFAAVHEKDDFLYDAKTGEVERHKFNPFSKERGAILGAWCIVRRDGMLPFVALIRFEEFNQPASQTWRQMPSVMIQKVARSTALRQAYPEQFGGIYERAEMDQAGPADNEKPAKEPRGLEAVREAVKATVVDVTANAELVQTLQRSIQAVEAKKAGEEDVTAQVMNKARTLPPPTTLTEKKARADLIRDALAKNPKARNRKTVELSLGLLEREIAEMEAPQPPPHDDSDAGASPSEAF